ncbi:hypothetical protein C2G38_1595122 [Gigaspora rosea]|uniref:Uncharacterized protein n=1 Tax=Gigaspora rosea TaxID=44941 RepID=A0A397V038_9GLOM|nr:hypothetical protein C2G38_1595122 [Gigaspora rosea]
MYENENADSFKDAEETLNINKSGRKIMRAQSEMGFSDNRAPRASIDIITPLPISFSDVGESLEGLLENNKKWAKTITAQVPTFFANHAKGQNPKIVWIANSRLI